MGKGLYFFLENNQERTYSWAFQIGVMFTNISKVFQLPTKSRVTRHLLLKDKLVKTKEENREGMVRSGYITYRANIMWSCIYLQNWRTSSKDRNQIKTYFENITKWNLCNNIVKELSLTWLWFNGYHDEVSMEQRWNGPIDVVKVI